MLHVCVYKCNTVYGLVLPSMCHFFSPNVTYVSNIVMSHDVTFSDITTYCNIRNFMTLCNLKYCLPYIYSTNNEENFSINNNFAQEPKHIWKILYM